MSELAAAPADGEPDPPAEPLYATVTAADPEGALTPARARRARLADALVHLLGVPLGAAAASVLVVLTLRLPQLDAATGIAVGLYALTLVAMLAISAAYNLTRVGVRREWLRRVDHATIFALIAGTYTPFMLAKVGGAWGLGFTLFVWACAALGATLKIAFPRRLERTSIALYLLLGWSVVMTLGPLAETVAPGPLWLLAAGGVLYTAGVGVYLLKRFTYHKALWHLCVLAAAICHYLAVGRAVGTF